MQSAQIAASANCNSPLTLSPRKAHKHWCPRALALGIMLAITAVSPLAHGQALTVLYSFGSGADGQQPGGGLVRDAAGNLYGTTSYGGNTNACPDGCGTIFKLDAAGVYSVLYRFVGMLDGQSPEAGLIRDAAGNLYGTTNIGGAFSRGTVFKLDTTGKETVLHSFGPDPDGGFPVAGLVRDAKGNLYGTTPTGGEATCLSGGCGTVFKVDTSGHETVLHAFTGGTDGELPAAPLIRDSAGNLYGTTDGGGTYSDGVVFKVDSASKETVLYSFAGGISDGSNPFGGLVTVGNKVYGTTGYGGAYGSGTVYEIDETTGKERLVYSFMGGADGKLPSTGLVRDKAGNLYGATEEGGGNGTVFEVDATGAETVLHHFAGGPAGTNSSPLILDEAGNLYGTCGVGGDKFFGTIFKIEP